MGRPSLKRAGGSRFPRDGGKPPQVLIIPSALEQSRSWRREAPAGADHSRALTAVSRVTEGSPWPALLETGWRIQFPARRRDARLSGEGQGITFAERSKPALPEVSCMGLGQPAAGAAASIAAALLVGEPIPVGDRTALYRRAVRLLPQVSSSGGWNALCELASCARREALSRTTPDELRRAAVAFLSQLIDEETVSRLVEAAVQNGTLDSDQRALIQAGGAAAIWSVARTLHQDRSVAVGEDLRELVVGFEHGPWREVMSQARRRSFEHVSTLFPLLSSLPLSSARRLVFALFSHADQRVRHRVMAFLLEPNREDEEWRKVVDQALEESDPVVVDMARSALLAARRRHGRLLAKALSPSLKVGVSDRVRIEMERRLAAEEETRSE